MHSGPHCYLLSSRPWLLLEKGQTAVTHRLHAVSSCHWNYLWLTCWCGCCVQVTPPLAAGVESTARIRKAKSIIYVITNNERPDLLLAVMGGRVLPRRCGRTWVWRQSPAATAHVRRPQTGSAWSAAWLRLHMAPQQLRRRWGSSHHWVATLKL